MLIGKPFQHHTISSVPVLYASACQFIANRKHRVDYYRINSCLDLLSNKYFIIIFLAIRNTNQSRFFDHPDISNVRTKRLLD